MKFKRGEIENKDLSQSCDLCDLPHNLYMHRKGTRSLTNPYSHTDWKNKKNN